VIVGGDVTAIEAYGPGIGSGTGEGVELIIIENGNITATSSEHGAHIGADQLYTVGIIGRSHEP
jgi:hypothetical protein